MKRSFHRLVLTALSVVTIGLPAPAMAASGTGGIAGHLIGGDRPVAGSWVTLYDANNIMIAMTTVDSVGAFAFSALEPESYRLQFRTPPGIYQWYHGKSSFDGADEVVVKAGEQTMVTENVLPTGAIAGQLADSSGYPVGGASVEADGVDPTGMSTVVTDPDGRYRMEVLPGRYTVSFTINGPDGILTQWARQASVPSEATVFGVSAGGTVIVDDQIRWTGSVSGHLVDTAGRALVGASVELYPAEAGRTLGATTDGQGFYHITALPGTYSLAFLVAGGMLAQWATGALSGEHARAIAVVSGTDTVIDDRLLPTGSVLVTAVDAATHRAIDDFCVGVEVSGACSEGSGQVLLTGVRQGHQQIDVRTDDGRYFPGQVVANVVGGQTVRASGTLAPAAVITITATDAKTGQPVSGICVWPVIQGGGFNSPNWIPDSYCSDGQGRVRMSPLPAGAYTLFAYTRYGGTEYGAQWVGRHGGTGDQLLARVVVARAGETTAVAPIKLDGAGTVTGTVRFAATGLPVRLGWASTNGQLPDANGQGVFTNIMSGDGGRYTLRGLGPYAWPLLFGAIGAAGTWSGGSPNRYLATRVTVTVGVTTTYDIALRGGTTLLGTVRDHAGAPRPSGFVIARNAFTGDPMGVGGIGEGGYKLRLLGPQYIKIEYYLPGSGGLRHGWYGGNDQAHATVVGIPAAGTATVDITLP